MKWKGLYNTSNGVSKAEESLVEPAREADIYGEDENVGRTGAEVGTEALGTGSSL